MLMCHSNGLTRRQLSNVTGIELGAVAGRVNALVADEVVTESGQVECHFTKKTVKLIKPVVEVQGELF